MERAEPEKCKLSQTEPELDAGTQPVRNPKFTKIIKRLYSAFFALFILTAFGVFALPENIGDTAVCAGFTSFMKQFFPNVAAAGIGPYARLAEFYVAAMWIPAILILALNCLLCAPMIWDEHDKKKRI